MKTKELEFFGISRQLKSEWKKNNPQKYRIIEVLELLDFEEVKQKLNKKTTIQNLKIAI